MPKGVVSEEKRCQGHNRRGEQCKKPAVAGRRYCKFHGGHIPVGKEHPNYKTGKYSKYFPDKLRERYEEFLANPDLITNRNEIAALETRLSELIENAEKDVSTRTWQDFIKLWNQFMFSIRTGDETKQIEYVGEINDFVEARASDDSIWSDIQSLSDTRRRLADSEARRLAQANQMLTVEQAMMLMNTLISAMKDVVYLYADPAAAKHIISGTSKAYIELIGVGEDSRNDTRLIADG